MTIHLQIILFSFFLVNIVSFVIMLLDKMKARGNNSERISEGVLFFMAIFFGGLGVYAGMFAFRHKTKKWYFLIGVPLAIIQNCIFIYFIYRLLRGELILL